VYPSARVFRLFVYDDYGRPLAADAVNRIQARVVTKETFDPATRKTNEISAFALKPSRNRAYLEARIDQRTLPAEMTAKVRFGADQPEYRFDFTFLAFSREPAAPVARRSVTEPVSPAVAPAVTPAAAPAPAAAATPAGGAASPGLDPLTPAPIPSSMSGMLEHLDIRARQVGELIARGDFSAVWVPAFQARDIAVALEPHVAHLSPEKRTAGEPALTRVVRTAWLLDAAGDVGNRTQIEAAHVAFKAAVAQVLTAFEDVR
jgi:hypothetical protein